MSCPSVMTSSVPPTFHSDTPSKKPAFPEYYSAPAEDTTEIVPEKKESHKEKPGLSDADKNKKAHIRCLLSKTELPDGLVWQRTSGCDYTTDSETDDEAIIATRVIVKNRCGKKNDMNVFDDGGEPCYVVRTVEPLESPLGYLQAGKAHGKFPYYDKALRRAKFDMLLNVGNVNLKWVAIDIKKKCEGGIKNVPEGAVQGGVDMEGKAIYVARMKVKGEIVAGKLVERTGLAYATDGKCEVARRNCEVLCVREEGERDEKCDKGKEMRKTIGKCVMHSALLSGVVSVALAGIGFLL